MPDAFGRAIRDFHLGEQTEPLLQRDGDDVDEHPIEDYYFGDVAESETRQWLESWLDGPLLDVGAGVGKHALYFQEQFETVAIEVSDHLVDTMRERGVQDARRGDMFELREQFDDDRFRSALCIGTQLCLAGSMAGLEEFLTDLAAITTDDATAVLHSYDPGVPEVSELDGYRPDPTPGLAHRVTVFEYEDEVDAILYFRLFSPDRLREAASATGWSIEDVVRPHWEASYRAALTKK